MLKQQVPNGRGGAERRHLLQKEKNRGLGVFLSQGASGKQNVGRDSTQEGGRGGDNAAV